MDSRHIAMLPASCGALRDVWSTINDGPPDIAYAVTTESVGSNPRSTCNGVHGLRSSHSAKHIVIFIGLPSVERSVPPGLAPPMLRMARRTARPIDVFARLPWPNAP